MDEGRGTIVRVVHRSAETEVHSTAGSRHRRQRALTALDRACTTDELEQLARIVSEGEISALKREALRRWAAN